MNRIRLSLTSSVPPIVAFVLVVGCTPGPRGNANQTSVVPVRSAFSDAELEASIDRIVYAAGVETVPDCEGVLGDAILQAEGAGWPRGADDGWIHDWKAGRLFAGLSEDAWELSNDPAGLPPDLARYCLFWMPEAVSTQSLPVEIRHRVLWSFEQATGARGRVSMDRAIGKPSGLMDADYVLPLQDRFAHEALGGTLQPGAAPQLVTLTLFDTAPSSPSTKLPGHQNSKHGAAIRRLTDSLLCDGPGDCAVEVRQRLALPLMPPAIAGGRPGFDPVNGGRFGNLSWLAESIRRESKTAPCTDCTKILVLPLGFGSWWVRTPTDTLDWDHDVQAVCSALLDAQDSGTTIVAAVGNAAGFGGPHREGPLLPAGWGTALSPTGGSPCRLGGEDLRIVPVAAVTDRGTPIGISRSRATPHITAYGNHARAADPAGSNQATEVMTGSSVAAAVVGAAIAAAAARERAAGNTPTSTPLIHDLWVRTPRSPVPGVTVSPHFGSYESSWGDQTKVVRVCEALDPCAGNNAPCCTPNGSEVALPKISDAVVAGSRNWGPTGTTASTSCGHPHYALGSTTPPAGVDPGCPEKTAKGPAETPWVNPAPLETPCPVCPLSIVRRLLGIGKENGFPNTAVFPVLSVREGNGSVTTFELEVPRDPMGNVNWVGVENSWSISNLPSGLDSARLTAVDQFTGDAYEAEIQIVE